MGGKLKLPKTQFLTLAAVMRATLAKFDGMYAEEIIKTVKMEVGNRVWEQKSKEFNMA